MKTTQKVNKDRNTKQSGEMVKIESELAALKNRVKQLEFALDEKDRELREVSINRAEFVQELNEIRNILRTTHLKSNLADKDGDSADFSTSKRGAKKQKKAEIRKSEKETKKQKKDSIDFLDTLEPDRLDLIGKYSYRERMILMNRIDIYRLFITVIIISSEIKYPRILSKVEEGELKLFINELSEFENMVLDLRTDENTLWEKGKTCEKQILQLFTNFFKV